MAATIKEICTAIEAEVHVEGDSAKPVERGSVGDLLSFVIGSDSDGTAWVTIQTHLNVAAVAVLKDIPIIIIASSREPAQDLIDRCQAENIALVTTPLSIFDACVALGKLGLKG